MLVAIDGRASNPPYHLNYHLNKYNIMQRKHLWILGAIAVLVILGMLFMSSFNNIGNNKTGGGCSYVTLEGDCKVSSIREDNVKITADIKDYYNYGVLVIDYTFTPTKPMEGGDNLGLIKRELIKTSIINERHVAYARNLAFKGINCLLKQGIDQNDYAYKSVKEKCMLNDNNVYECSFPDITRQDLGKCGIKEGAIIHCKLTRSISGSCTPRMVEYFEN